MLSARRTTFSLPEHGVPVRAPRPPPSSSRFGSSKRTFFIIAMALCAALSLGWRPRQKASDRRGSGGRQLTQQAEGEVAAVAEAVAAPAVVHGFVTKEGPLDLRSWHRNHKAWREQRVQQWLADRHRNLAAGQRPPPLPIYTGCQVFVNHLYKIIYLRHAKTASSSLFCHFGGCREEGNSSSSSSSSSNEQKGATSFELLQVNSTSELEQLWKEYFVVTFIRNPYQRAISSFKMMMRQLVRGGPVSRSYTWNHFCADPASFADECMRDEWCKRKGRNFVYIHIQPQHECIIAENGGWAVDFIGRVEHIDEDLTTVLNELEKRRPADAPPVRPLEGSLENVNGRGCNEVAEPGHAVAKEQYCEPADYYTGRHAGCFSHIRHHYAYDAKDTEL